MAEVMITWMDGSSEQIHLGRDDRLAVKQDVLSVIRARYPAREDGEQALNIPLVNVRSFAEYE